MRKQKTKSRIRKQKKQKKKLENVRVFPSWFLFLELYDIFSFDTSHERETNQVCLASQLFFCRKGYIPSGQKRVGFFLYSDPFPTETTVSRLRIIKWASSLEII